MTNNTTNPHYPVMLTVLQHVPADRLQRAVNALVNGSLTITLTRQTEAEIRALVRNGEGREYGLTLTQTGVFCSCKDALYRASVCKHVTAVALSVLRTPQSEGNRIHLAFGKEKPTLCGVVHPARVWLWPYWPDIVWKEACMDCEAVRKQPALAKVAA
jgi:hypothetical protein